MPYVACIDKTYINIILPTKKDENNILLFLFNKKEYTYNNPKLKIFIIKAQIYSLISIILINLYI